MLFFNALVWLSRECRFAEISGQFWSPTGSKRLARTHSALLCQTAGIWGHGRGSYRTARTDGGKQGKLKYTVLRIMMIKKGARKTPLLRLPCLRRCYLGDRASYRSYRLNVCIIFSDYKCFISYLCFSSFCPFYQCYSNRICICLGYCS